MKQIPTNKALSLACCLFILVGCATNSTLVKEEVTAKADVFSEAYYLQFKSTELRFAQLLCGRFSCYKGIGGELFLVNNGKDSILVETVMVGDPNKDGIWVYKESFMSNYPEKPLLQLFQKIERVSPDSLNLHEYRPKSKENSYIGYYKKKAEERSIDMKDFVSTGCSAGVKKLGQTKFEYYADMCKRNRGDNEQWIDAIVTCIPSRLTLRSRKYSKPVRADENKLSGSFLHYKRLNPVN